MAHEHGHGSEDLGNCRSCSSTGSSTGTAMSRTTGNGLQKASQAGEEEIAKEIHLAIADSEAVKNHLKRAKAILAAKLVLKK